MFKTCKKGKPGKFLIKEELCNLPEKMIFERNQDGTYRAYINGCIIWDIENNLSHKSNLTFPKVEIDFSNYGFGFLPNFIQEIIADYNSKELFTIEMEKSIENYEDVVTENMKMEETR